MAGGGVSICGQRLGRDGARPRRATPELGRDKAHASSGPARAGRGRAARDAVRRDAVRCACVRLRALRTGAESQGVRGVNAEHADAVRDDPTAGEFILSGSVLT